MTTHRIQRTVRMCVLSTLLALVALSFSVFGSASAHALTQTTGNTSVTVARIIVNQQGATVFSPSAVSVTSGATVKIVNKTSFTKILFLIGGIQHLLPGAALRINPTQSEVVGICGGGSLTITVA